MVDTLIPRDGSGPVWQEEEACLASESTFSLPLIPQCPGTKVSRTLLEIANVCNAVIASATKPVVASWAETALIAVQRWLSPLEKIGPYACGCVCICE